MVGRYNANAPGEVRKKKRHPTSTGVSLLDAKCHFVRPEHSRTMQLHDERDENQREMETKEHENLFSNVSESLPTERALYGG